MQETETAPREIIAKARKSLVDELHQAHAQGLKVDEQKIRRLSELLVIEFWLLPDIYGPFGRLTDETSSWGILLILSLEMEDKQDGFKLMDLNDLLPFIPYLAGSPYSQIKAVMETILQELR